jgi:hypothetical protein
MKEKELNLRWAEVIKKLNFKFDQDFELDGILFLIGIQELGKGYIKLNKDQKMDVIHIAVCHLLSNYGYYEYVGRDEDGWPHFAATEELPYLKPMQQHKLIKEAIIDYFVDL